MVEKKRRPDYFPSQYIKDKIFRNKKIKAMILRKLMRLNSCLTITGKRKNN